jgi:hypothetical protein
MATRALKPANTETVGDVLEQMDRENASLHAAMALAFAEIESATKSAPNEAFKRNGKASKYADLPAVIEAVKPALVNHGLFFTQHCHPSEDGVIVETVLGHSSGESMSMGSLYVPANKRDPHGFGSALTYARRYALQTAFGVPTEDDDGNAAVASIQSTPKAAYTLDPALKKQIEELAPKAGKTVGGICAAYSVEDLSDLSRETAEKAISALKRLAKEPA